MMLLKAELIIILVLLIALIALIIEERKIKKARIPKGTVKEYWSGKERRQYTRIKASLLVRYIVAKNSDSRVNGRIENISSDGMKLLVNEKLVEGCVLELEFNIPNAKHFIMAQGKVMWADGKFNERDEIGRRIFQTGIQFLSIKTEDKNRLVEYINKVADKI